MESNLFSLTDISSFGEKSLEPVFTENCLTNSETFSLSELVKTGKPYSFDLSIKEDKSSSLEEPTSKRFPLVSIKDHAQVVPGSIPTIMGVFNLDHRETKKIFKHFQPPDTTNILKGKLIQCPMPRKNFSKKRKEKKIATERMSRLYDMARENISTHPLRAQRYTEIANKIQKKIKAKPERKYKRMICGNCKKLKIPGLNCRVRLTGKTITYYCLECKHFTRIGYKGKKHSKEGK